MTTDQLIAKVKKDISQVEKCFSIAVSTTHAAMMDRIFIEGLDASGNKIGNYDSSHPIYVNPKDAPKSFPAKGKSGKTAFKNGNRHKTGYFDSYKAFRQKQGRESSFVNLRLFGHLQSDLSNSLKRIAPGIITTGVKNKANAMKLSGIMKKYGANVFRISRKEEELLRSSFLYELKKQGIIE